MVVFKQKFPVNKSKITSFLSLLNNKIKNSNPSRLKQKIMNEINVKILNYFISKILNFFKEHEEITSKKNSRLSKFVSENIVKKSNFRFSSLKSIENFTINRSSNRRIGNNDLYKIVKNFEKSSILKRKSKFDENNNKNTELVMMTERTKTLSVFKKNYFNQ